MNQEVVPVPMNLVAPAEEPCIKKLLPESVKGSSLEFDFHCATLRVTDQTSDALLAKGTSGACPRQKTKTEYCYRIKKDATSNSSFIVRESEV